MNPVQSILQNNSMTNLGSFSSLSMTSGASSVSNGEAISEGAKLSNEISQFQNLLDSISREAELQSEKLNNSDLVSQKNLVQSSRLNGDYLSSFATKSNQAEKNARPQGEAANSANSNIKSHTNRTIDKTSALYEKSLELESYFVKILLNSMKSTISHSEINGKQSYASSMYTDMLYDEYNVILTKNAGFGLADQIYLQLNEKA
jgi:flagellar protein FlgJ